MSSFASRPRPKSLFRWWRDRRNSGGVRRSHGFRSRIEWLEDRVTPSSYPVTNTNASGTGSLAAAIAAANTAVDTDAQITFTGLPNNSTIQLGASDTDGSAAYGPTAYVVNSGVNITINGSSAPGLTIDGGGAIRLFEVDGTLTVNNVTLSGGLAQGGNGGASGLGDAGGSGGGGAGLGGAVFVAGGSFTADGSTFLDDIAQGGQGGPTNDTANTTGGGGGGLGAGANGADGSAGGAGSGVGGNGGADGDAGSAGALGGGGGGGGNGADGGVGGFGGGAGGAGALGNGGAGGFGGGNGGDGLGNFSGGGGGGAGLGGGIFSNAGSVTLVNDTFTGNTATGGSASVTTNSGGNGSGLGGAVFVRNGTLAASFVTFSGNTSGTGAASDVYVLSDGATNQATATLVDDILGQSGTSTDSDFFAATTNGGTAPALGGSSHDFVSNPANTDPSNAASLPTSAVVNYDSSNDTYSPTDPMLLAPAANGGDADTMAVDPGSPVIGVGTPTDFPGTSTAITTDQRGTTRSAMTPNLGSYEEGSPAVTGVSPTSGPLAGGNSVVITGTGFTGATEVEFGSTAATSYTVNNDTEITAVAPAGTGPVDVTVTTPVGTSTTSPADQYTYVAAPAVTGVSPPSGPLAGGTSVTVSGSGFTGATVVDFGTTPATTFTVISATQITAVSPAGTGTVDVTVVAPGGTSSTSSADQFSYVAAPTVASINPTSGPTVGGGSVMIHGTGFTGASVVDFGTVAATAFTVNSNTLITATAPAGTAGTVDVKVTAPGGTSTTSSADQFTYVSAPTVTGVSPTSGPSTGGTLVTITGTGFTGATTVHFASNLASSFTVISATQITVTTPAGAGTVDVTVTTVGGTSATSTADQFTYLSPTVTFSVSTINVGSTNTGTAGTSVPFTVGATNLTTSLILTAPSGVELSDDGGTTYHAVLTLPETGGTVASTTIDARIAATTATGSLVGYIEGTSTGLSPSPYIIVTGTVHAALPTVTGISPSSGTTSGGTIVTITGANLGNAGIVFFGSQPSTKILSDTATQIQVIAPTAAAGTVGLTVVTPSGTSSTSNADEYTYVGGPLITVNPTVLNLGTTTSGTVGPVETFVVSATNLLGDVVIKAPRGVKLSAYGGTRWVETLKLRRVGTTLVPTTIDVAIKGAARAGTIDGSIIITSHKSASHAVAVTGTVNPRG